MDGCCGRKTGMTPDIKGMVMEKFDAIRKIFGTASLICILSSEGKTLVTHDEEDHNLAEITNSLFSLRKAAEKFGQILKVTEVPVIHIRGTNNIFSFYDVDKNILAFCTTMHRAMAAQFNTTHADAQMRTVVDDLRILIDQLDVF